MTVQVSFDWKLPAEIFAEDFQESDLRSRVQETVALTLYKEGRISSAIAANLLGMTRRDFWQLLHEKRVAYFDLDHVEIAKEWAAVDELRAKHAAPRNITPFTLH